METLTRRELLRRLGRAAIAAPVILATKEQQADVLYNLSRVFGSTPIGTWLRDLWLWW